MSTRTPSHSVRRVVLREYETTEGLRLSADDRDALVTLHPGLRVSPLGRGTERYSLTPDQHVGVLRLPNLVVEIQPKIPMPSALYLISQASGSVHWHPDSPSFAEDASFADLVAMMLARLVTSATRKGLLHGYREEVGTAQAPRGRILFDKLMGRRFGRGPPIDVRRDRYTADILENRVLLAALQGLKNLRPSSIASRQLADAQTLFGGVTLEHLAPHDLPEIDITPLNAHYEAALSLALMVQASSYLRLGAGAGRGVAFLVNMNVVFERFVRNVLRRALGGDCRSFPTVAPKTYLDERSRVQLVPDLTYVMRGRVVWVGDAKYKMLPESRHISSDLYQLHAYSSALGLPEGTLVYGTGVTPCADEHHIHGSRIVLRVHELNVNTTPLEIEGQVERLARRVALSLVAGHNAEGSKVAV